MSRTQLLIAAGILVAAGALAVLMVNLRPEPPRAGPSRMAPAVGTARAERYTGPLTVVGSGTVRPRAQIELAPQVGGNVVWVSPSLVSGGRIREGEVLLRIEEDDYRNAVEQARAQVAQEQVAVLQAEEEARIARREYRQFVERRGGDSLPAVAADSLPGVDPDSAAQASGLVFREPQLEAARASLDRARAQLADAELALGRTVVRAPFDGVVRTEDVDAGAFRAAGQTVATLYASDAVEVVVPLTDEEAALLPDLWELQADDGESTLPAEVVALYGRDRFAWDGYVHRVEAALDETSRTLDVVVRVPDPFRTGRPVDSTVMETPPPLLVGQFADVRFEGRSGTWVEIPRRALRTDNEVWTVEDGLVRIVPVRLVQRVENRVQVVGDISDGTPVITDGVDVVTNGMAVRLRSAAPGGPPAEGSADRSVAATPTPGGEGP
jgi:RND family efflux transporter MFP subunit